MQGEQTAVGRVRIGLRTTDHQTRILFTLSDAFAIELESKAAELVGRALAAAALRLPVGELPSGWRVEAQGLASSPASVLIGGPSGKSAVLPNHAASAIGGHLIAKARAAEEQNEAERIALDQAHLLRIDGIPLGDGGRLRLGLTDDPRIQDLAGNLAATDSTIRRNIPGGVRASSHFPRPAVVDAETYRRQKGAA